jgi:hypothetical protein
MHEVEMTAFTLKLRKVPRSVWRIGLALGAIVLGAGLISACSDPERYRAPWCSNFGDGGAYECSYVSFEQCQAAVSGAGGLCVLNPRNSNDGAKRRRPVARPQ